jgi:dephospho-CoA kinase
MTTVLVTGMSGTGKSTLVEHVRAHGWTAVDLDDGYVRPLPDGRQLWDESRVTQLLDSHREGVLLVAGCEENMVEFLPCFDLIVLLSAPAEVIVQRIRERTGNDFGKRPGELEHILADLDAVEPLLRRVSHLEIITTVSADEVAQQVIAAVKKRS